RNRDRRHLDLARLGLACRRTVGGDRSLALDRGDSDLLLLVLAVDSRSSPAISVRVRVVLAVALLLVVGVLALDASGRAPRTAGSDHTSPAVFSAAVPGGGVLCQPASYLPADAARVQMLIGTYGRPVPDLRLSFIDAKGLGVAT